jgi:serine/threonine protein phosphatase PrpC
MDTTRTDGLLVGPCPAPAAGQDPLPLGRRLAIGDAGRSFTEVMPVLPVGEPNPPDTVLDAGALGPFDIRAASVCGLAHRQLGKPRQDAYSVRTDGTGRWLIIVVADGVSQGPFSHKAANLVVQHGSRAVAEQLASTPAVDIDWYELFNVLGSRVLAAGQRVLSHHQPAVQDPAVGPAQIMATTATFVVCDGGPTGPTRSVTVAWLGDTPVWSVSPTGAWRCLSAVKAPVDGLSTSAVTALPYVPTSAAGLPIRSEAIDVHDTLLVMTDGVADPIGDATGEVAAQLARWWREPPGPLAFAEQIAFGRKGYDDDRTVVAVWPRNGPSR